MNHVGVFSIAIAAFVCQNMTMVMSIPVLDVMEADEPTMETKADVLSSNRTDDKDVLEYAPNTDTGGWLETFEEKADTMYSYVASVLKHTQNTVGGGGLEPTEDKADDGYNYVAAVLEYAPKTDAENGLETIISNALSYIVFAQEAKNAGADIIVFPEYGLTGTGLPVLPTSMLPYTQIIPDPAEAISPCDAYGNSTSASIEALRLLSCAARDLQLYLVVDLAEQVTNDEGLTAHHFYNTQIVLDREGTLIARYRKRNLFGEFQFRPGPEESDSAIFTTDFGVTFTLQVCFDILYKYPGVVNVKEKGIKHVAMSTAWMDQLPSLTAPQMQSAWAESLGVNLLVANIHNPTSGFTGSGIYPGDTDLEHLYTYNSQGSRLVIMNITSNDFRLDTNYGAVNMKNENLDNEKIKDNGNIFNISKINKDNHNISKALINDVNNINTKMSNVDDNEHKFKYEDLSIYSHLTLNQTIKGEKFSQSLCHTEEFCCNIEYTWPETNSNITYMLLAFDGLQSHLGGFYKTYYQVCSLLYCSSDNVLTCAYVDDNFIPQSNTLKVTSLEGVFDSPYVYPSVLNQDLTLAKRDVWSFDNTNNNSNKWKAGIHVDKGDDLDQILAITLFGRLYNLDP